MKNFSVFDIVGPIMIGPSSSHTAGAARLGKMARAIFGNKTPKKAMIYLHGSFANTYKGHGTDLAIIAGLLGFETDSVQLRNSFEFAKKENLDFTFIPTDLGALYHPNTAKIVLFDDDDQSVEIIGKSVGGGNIVISEIDGYEISLRGDFPTIFTKHQDVPGIISKVSNILAKNDINIAFMKVFRKEKRKDATMVIESDDIVSDSVLHELSEIPCVQVVRFIEPV